MDSFHITDSQIYDYLLTGQGHPMGKRETMGTGAEQDDADNQVGSDNQFNGDIETHLASCSDCRDRLQFMEKIVNDMYELRTAQPAQQQMEKYFALFSEVATPRATNRASEPSLFQELMETLRLTLRMDTRRLQPDFALRNAGDRSFRLLYSAQDIELELMLEREGSVWFVQGDVLPAVDGSETEGSVETGSRPASEATVELPCLVQLRPYDHAVSEDSDIITSELLASFGGEDVPAGGSKQPTLQTVETVTTDDIGAHFQFKGVAPGRYELLLTPVRGPLIEISDLTIP